MFNENWFVKNFEKKILTNKFLSCQNTNTKIWHEKCSISLWRRWNGGITSQVEYSKHFSQQQRRNKKQRCFLIKFLNIVDGNSTLNFIWQIDDFNKLEIRVTIDNLKKIIVANSHDFINTIENIVKKHKKYVKRVKNLKQKNNKLIAKN